MQQTPTIPQPSPSENTPGSPETFTTSKRPSEGLGSIVSTILIILAAPIIALTLTAFVFQSYEVEGPSMESTLQNRDRLIVIKAGKTWARVTGGHFTPKRSEIVIFEKQGIFDVGHSSEKQLIKRVVGLPGDRVVIQEGIVTVYNDRNPNGFRPDGLPEYKQVIGPTSPDVDITVGENEIFVLGDNRPNSLDSRSFGTISTDDVIGTLALRIFPLNALKNY